MLDDQTDDCSDGPISGLEILMQFLETSLERVLAGDVSERTALLAV